MQGAIDGVIFAGEEQVSMLLAAIDRILVDGGMLLQITDDSPEERVPLVKSLLPRRSGQWAAHYQHLETDDNGFDYCIYCFTKPGGGFSNNDD